MMTDPSHILDGAMVEEIPHPFTRADSPQLLAQADVVGEMLFGLMPFGIGMGSIYWPLCSGIGLGLIHQIGHPGGNGLDQNLCPFALEKFKHMEVAVAFGELRPEFAGYLDYRLYAGAVDFDRVQFPTGSGESVQVILAPHVFVPFAKRVEGVA